MTAQGEKMQNESNSLELIILQPSRWKEKKKKKELEEGKVEN